MAGSRVVNAAAVNPSCCYLAVALKQRKSEPGPSVECVAAWGSSNYGLHLQQHYALLQHLDSFLFAGFECSVADFDGQEA